MSDTATILKRRERLLGPNMTTFYADPVHIMRGEGAWLWDADGRKFLDCYNNVPHVGHAHPKVVEAISRQASTLNTHTRYLHEGILDYGERLTSTMDHDLDAMIMVCTGSEANDIALRMGRAVTGKTGIICTDNTYHGNTDLVSHLSAKKTPIGGAVDWVRKVPSPDAIAPLSGSLEAQAQAFADEIQTAIDTLEADGHGFGTLILCPFFANEGFPDLPHGFLDPTVDVVRRAGGIIIADEVQPGFGRTGRNFWGHERIGLVPDIVTMGKPMGNGHPVAAVVTRPEIMAEFRTRFGYFNTFGGNPVSAAAAMAVLDVLEEENLVENARDTGDYALGLLGQLDHPMIADVRGAGLFLGVEFAKDGDTAAAADFCAALVDDMRHRAVLLHSVGRHYHGIKIRPPMCFDRAQADLLVETLDTALKALPI
ncbi:aminotransferase class III-fold pyridoxal phosphate-dependent enzyme [Aliiroseovarius sp. S1339]|uniref:aspartate aminotransferase family protein n=1 Tax=Aliiroseovarius sp. S1339 TaxID=2936990 RepID=UPI0020BF830E|nr:aminotransferase class III-fold pyridoxal phosphate-dependent enzyme [Aliiroseovarius sp. S1339]MCK8463983.1 aminotransferase class III-fold pyridoxal phosphate-dependent enzyme [Aliiroseovarius sp. S1339]